MAVINLIEILGSHDSTSCRVRLKNSLSKRTSAIVSSFTFLLTLLTTLLLQHGAFAESSIDIISE